MAGQYEYIGLRVEIALLGRLDARAKRDGVTRSKAIRALLERGLK